MSEETAKKYGFTHRYDGVAFDIERASLTLISIVLADKELKKLYSKYDLGHLETMTDEIREHEIVRLLVEIATQYRLMEWNVSEEWKNKDFKTKHVGLLLVDKKEEPLDLTMREACNKIIHAEEIIFDIGKIRGHALYYHKPVIHLYGKRGKQGWKASIDLILFCNAANQQVESIF